MAQDDRINVRDHKIKFEFSFLERMRTHTIGNTLCTHKNLGCYQSRQNMIHKTLCVLKILNFRNYQVMLGSSIRENSETLIHSQIIVKTIVWE